MHNHPFSSIQPCSNTVETGHNTQLTFTNTTSINYVNPEGNLCVTFFSFLTTTPSSSEPDKFHKMLVMQVTFQVKATIQPFLYFSLCNISYFFLQISTFCFMILVLVTHNYLHQQFWIYCFVLFKLSRQLTTGVIAVSEEAVTTGKKISNISTLCIVMVTFRFGKLTSESVCKWPT